MKLKKLLIAAALVAPGFVYAAPTQTTCPTGSQGTKVDLTTGAAAGMQSVNGGFVTWTASQPTGSGFIDSFVRVSANTDCVQGYNTDSRPLQFDENTSATFTHDLLLSAVPIVNIGGVNYREFLLDINQTGAQPLLSLDKIEIYSHNTASATGYGSGVLASPSWSLDGAGNKYIDLDFSLNSGSGSGDMLLYVPNTAFTGTYVTLYSFFGVPNPNNDGYEEWAVRQAHGQASEPGMLALFGISLLAFGYVRRRRTA